MLDVTAFDDGALLARALDLDSGIPDGIAALLDPDLFDFLCLIGADREDIEEDDGDGDPYEDREPPAGDYYTFAWPGFSPCSTYVHDISGLLSEDIAAKLGGGEEEDP